MKNSLLLKELRLPGANKERLQFWTRSKTNSRHRLKDFSFLSVFYSMRINYQKTNH